MRRVGVLGSGVVGRTLAQGFARHGYQAQIGSRTPSKLAEFTASSGIPARRFAEVASWAEVCVLAVKGTAADEVLRLAGATNLRGKILIDTTNPISDAPPVDGVIQYFTGPNESLLERLQTAYPQVRFVKAFSCVGNARMVNPSFTSGTPTMFYCGNDPEAKAFVAEVVEQFGFEPADMGTAVAAGAIERLAQLWCIPGFRQNTWTHAFCVLWS